MKVRLSYSLVLAALLLALPLTSYSQSPSLITESKALALIDAVDRAARKGNVAAMIAPLARDAKLKATISIPGKQDTVLNLTKEQFAFHTRRGLKRRLAYTLLRKNTRVKVYEDGKNAMITSDLYETLTIQQGTLRTVTSEVAILSLRDGKIVVTSVESKMRFY